MSFWDFVDRHMEGCFAFAFVVVLPAVALIAQALAALAGQSP